MKRFLSLQTSNTSASDNHCGQLKVLEGVIRELEGKVKMIEAQSLKFKEDWSNEK